MRAIDKLDKPGLWIKGSRGIIKKREKRQKWSYYKRC